MQDQITKYKNFRKLKKANKGVLLEFLSTKFIWLQKVENKYRRSPPKLSFSM